MRTTFLNILKTGLPTAFVLAVMGYGLSQMAVMWHVDQTGTSQSWAAELSNSLEYRLPITMAAWGFGVIVICELFRGIWRKPMVTKPAEPVKEVVDAEQLLLQLLDQADAAEKARASC